MGIPTQAQADRNTRAAIKRAQQGIAKLEGKRSKYSGRELRDIDEQIAQLQRTIARFEQVLNAG